MHIVLFHFHTSKPNPVYQEISAGLRRRGHTVWVGVPNEEGDLEWRDGNRVIEKLPGPPKEDMHHKMSFLQRRLGYFCFLWRVRSFLSCTKPDIIQVNPSMLAWVLTLFMPRTSHCVLDIRQINEAVDERWITKLKEQRDILVMKAYAELFYKHTCFCHVNAAQKILGDQWVHKGSVVPVGIDSHFLQHEGLDIAIARNDNKVKFIYIGTLSRLRTLEQILAAAKLLMPETKQFHVDIIGPDLTDGYYHQLVKEWNLEEIASVGAPVPYSAIPATLGNYDVGLAYVPDRPTWHYQPTIKALEYRAIGMPILSTDVASHREIVVDGKNGLLVQDTPESIAAGMKRLISDRQFLHQCKINAQAMRQGLTWDEVATRYEQEVYIKLAGQVARKQTEVAYRGS
jgi:glycosyltransferase involved in cell wall biosynthesis